MDSCRKALLLNHIVHYTDADKRIDRHSLNFQCDAGVLSKVVDLLQVKAQGARCSMKSP